MVEAQELKDKIRCILQEFANKGYGHVESINITNYKVAEGSPIVVVDLTVVIN
jgi:hypothetical protein